MIKKLLKSLYARVTSLDALQYPQHAYRVYQGKAQKVELFFWKPKDYQTIGHNFGDELSQIIIDNILQKKKLSLRDKIRKYKLFKSTHRLLGIGSIIHYARDGATIWGSGINGKCLHMNYNFKSLDVRLVRGPLTRNFLLEKGIPCPENFGDPALLMPCFYPAKRKPSKSKFILIPNLNDLDSFKHYDEMISPLEDWRVILNAILETDLVISTSLHGIILADAYGVPAIYLKSSVEHPFKYMDYYLGTNREYVAADTIAEALIMEPAPPPNYNSQRMLNSFPFDLWI